MAITPLLNVFLNYNDTRQPVLVSAASLVPARGIQVVGGEKVTLRVYFVNTAGASPTYVVPVEADAIRFTAKKQASDEDLIYLFDEWTISGTYIETTADFATVEGFWDTATDAAKSLISNIEVETEAGLVRKWSFFTQVVRQSYGGEDPPVNPGETFVKYTAQTPTSEQQAQALANLGVTISESATNSTVPRRTSGGFINSGAFWASSVSFGSGLGTLVGNAGAAGRNAAGDATWIFDSETGNGTIPGTLTVTSSATIGSVIIGTSTLSTTANTLSCSENFEVGSNLTVNGDIDAPGSAATFSSIFAGGGAFGVSQSGDMTATHGKFQGSGGQAGHIQLKQGTTPNGTANETTVWGIAGGIGWRDGTGTAYTLLLPTASGSTGVLASSSEAVAGVNTANVMTPALSALQDASPIVKDGFSGAGWTQYSSPTGGFGTGNTDFGVDISFGTATGGTGRYNGPGNTAALYVGKGRGVINWSKPGAVSFLLLFYSTELDAVSTFRMGWGKSSTGLTWGDPAVKYIGIARTGTGVLRIQTHNGTTLTNTNTTFTPTLNQAAFVHLSWDGAGNVAITVNGTSYGTATGAPTGDGSSTENRIIAEGQNTSTATLQGNVQVSDLALTRHMF